MKTTISDAQRQGVASEGDAPTLRVVSWAAMIAEAEKAKVRTVASSAKPRFDAGTVLSSDGPFVPPVAPLLQAAPLGVAPETGGRQHEATPDAQAALIKGQAALLAELRASLAAEREDKARLREMLQAEQANTAAALAELREARREKQSFWTFWQKKEGR